MLSYKGFILIFFFYYFNNNYNTNAIPVLNTCNSIKQILQVRNITATVPEEPITGGKLSICPSDKSCCTEEIELKLRPIVKNDYEWLLQQHAQSAQGLLASTAVQLEEYIDQMMSNAKNVSLKLFHEAFKLQSTVTDDIVKNFFNDLNEFINDRDDLEIIYENIINQKDDKDNKLNEITNTFFKRLFPIIFENTIISKDRTLDPEYISCLETHIDDIKPYGNIINTLSKDISRIFDATRVLIEALNFGVDVLNKTDVLSDSNNMDQCHRALLKMSYCSKCNAPSVAVTPIDDNIKPCLGYCLNVMRGCVTQHSVELDLPWQGYYEVTDKLLSVINNGRSLSLDGLLRSLHSRIADPIMLFMEQSSTVHDKVKLICGHARWINNNNRDKDSSASKFEIEDSNSSFGILPGVSLSTKGPGNHPDWTLNEDSNPTRSNVLNNIISIFKDSVLKSRGFYSNLAETLCADESYTEKTDAASCWNGERVGQYMKTVVPVAISSQKYNPEVKWTGDEKIDPKVLQLVEKLRHVKTVIQSRVGFEPLWSSNPESDSYVMKSEGEEGSGNGPISSKEWNDDDDDSDPNFSDQGSGSGAGELPVYTPKKLPENKHIAKADNNANKGTSSNDSIAPKAPTKPPSGSAGLEPCILLTLFVAYISLIWF